jgi:hypothetical protein
MRMRARSDDISTRSDDSDDLQMESSESSDLAPKFLTLGVLDNQNTIAGIEFEHLDHGAPSRVNHTFKICHEHLLGRYIMSALFTREQRASGELLRVDYPLDCHGPKVPPRIPRCLAPLLNFGAGL